MNYINGEPRAVAEVNKLLVASLFVDLFLHSRIGGLTVQTSDSKVVNDSDSHRRTKSNDDLPIVHLPVFHQSNERGDAEERHEKATKEREN